MQITRAKEPQRVHVWKPEDWNRSAGTDFWAFFGSESTVAAAGSSALLSDSGWITTSLVETAGSGADFLSSADRNNPPHILTDASGDLIQSPPIFGDYNHALMAGRILGRTITKMTIEFVGAFTVRSANEVASGFGLIEAGGSAALVADHMAWFWIDGGVSDTYQFEFANGAGSDAGESAVSTFRTFKIVGTFGGSWEWFIDDVSQGTLAIQADLFPVSFGMHASTTNRPALSWVHISYD